VKNDSCVAAAGSGAQNTAADQQPMKCRVDHRVEQHQPQAALTVVATAVVAQHAMMKFEKTNTPAPTPSGASPAQSILFIVRH
jgi:hypothetical protein